ncbi:cadherin-like protein 26 isoform X2 [Clupea harengus]|nr:cadherin-like protein 26 isoform X2 [Clupea harengus]
MGLSRNLIRQKRDWIIESYSIDEEHPGPFPFCLGKITVNNEKRELTLIGPGATEDPVDLITIDDEKQLICINGPLDYEQPKILNVVYEENTPSGRASTRLGVEIKVLDINDNPPVFSKEIYYATLEESKQQGSEVVTVQASDADEPGTNNSTFKFRIESILPVPTNAHFDINTKGESGIITFKGCLDYKKENKYTILVEAKDQGEKKQLSSTSTVIVEVLDQNNHHPATSIPFVHGRVKENEKDIQVGRLQVTDKDTKGTAAWKAKYALHGDQGGHFKITTDPETNEGVLTIEKPLDYEKLSMKNLSVSVENEEPLFCCEVKVRSATQLWEVDREKCLLVATPPQFAVTIEVENVNEPPIFKPAVKHVYKKESIAVGSYLEKLTAHDPDDDNAMLKYFKGEDPAGWVSVDPKTGEITTANNLDRESPYVKNNVYTVIIYSVENGKAPLTGTGTLIIHLADVNDNLPILEQSQLDMCLSDELVKISVRDPDQSYNSGPYYFEILGDVQRQWRLEPKYGNTSNLIKESVAYAGRHSLKLKISDRQGLYLEQNLHVTVCDCTGSTSTMCETGQSRPQLAGRAVAVPVIALLLLLCILLMMIKCEKRREFIPLPGTFKGHVRNYCTEGPGQDIKPVQKNDGVNITQLPSQIQITTQGMLPSLVCQQQPCRECILTKGTTSAMSKWTGSVCNVEFHPNPIPIPTILLTEPSSLDLACSLSLDPNFKPLDAICRPPNLPMLVVEDKKCTFPVHK